MIRYTQTIRRPLSTNCLSVFDHFVGLALKELLYLSHMSYDFNSTKYISVQAPDKVVGVLLNQCGNRGMIENSEKNTTKNVREKLLLIENKWL